MTVHRLTDADADWAAGLMAARREVYAAYSPVFWRPRRGDDVVRVHAAFLCRQIGDPATVAVRTEHGFLVAQRRTGLALVDDFAVEADDLWATDGRDLLTAAWQAVGKDLDTLKVVTALADEPKARMLRAAGLQPVEQWWVRPIGDPARSSDPAPRRFQGQGFSGIVGPAPPVYDPGGPVALIDTVSDPNTPADPLAIEQEAARHGAVLAVLPLALGNPYEPALRQREWAVASQWYAGRPRHDRDL